MEVLSDIYDVLKIDVSTRHNQVDIDELGFTYDGWKFIKTVVVLSSSIASAYLIFNEPSGAPIPVSVGDSFEDMKIERIYFTNTLTSAGGTVVLYLDGVKA